MHNELRLTANNTTRNKLENNLSLLFFLFNQNKFKKTKTKECFFFICVNKNIQ